MIIRKWRFYTCRRYSGKQRYFICVRQSHEEQVSARASKRKDSKLPQCWRDTDAAAGMGLECVADDPFLLTEVWGWCKNPHTPRRPLKAGRSPAAILLALEMFPVSTQFASSFLSSVVFRLVIASFPFPLFVWLTSLREIGKMFSSSLLIISHVYEVFSTLSHLVFSWMLPLPLEEMLDSEAQRRRGSDERPAVSPFFGSEKPLDMPVRQSKCVTDV